MSELSRPVPIRTIGGHRYAVSAFVLSADGRWLVSSGGEYDPRPLAVWNLNGTNERPFRVAQLAVNRMTLSPDGRALVCCVERKASPIYSEEAHVLLMPRLRPVATFRIPARSRLLFTPDGRELLAVD